MSYDAIGRRRPTKPKKQARAQKRKRDDVDVEQLEQAVRELDPKAQPKTFASLPLSLATQTGLKASSYTALTDIQRRAIPLALQGRDILGAARTGSGKTLAFLIPVLENLYRQQCVGTDAGLAAMIISPTRELAIQIFEVLRKIGRHGHMHAAGLIIGGRDFHEEQAALARMNVVVCTPGRMLQHLSQTPLFSPDSLRMLVLDEADRILDMGFQRDVDAIVEYLPAERQTLLFSATQTKKVSDLARLSLKDPEYVAVHEASASATPASLAQNYTLTPLPSKLDTLWSFLQSAKKSKILVFLSSGKQVRFVYEAFRRMQPGIPLLHLHGRQRQSARLDITSRFSSARHSCLFATDVVARGLDFPAVDWVVQVDCPEDADTYIHRVGRTARYERDGRAVLFLDPSEEEGFLTKLEARKVAVERINVKQSRQRSVKDQLTGMCYSDPQVKYLGQKAFASYVRSLHLQKDRDVFDINKYDLEGFAASLGLPGAPRIKFLKGSVEAAKQAKNAPRTTLSDSDDLPDEEEEEDGQVGGNGPTNAAAQQDKLRTKHDRMFERKNQDVLTSHYARMIDDSKSHRTPHGDAFSGTPLDGESDDELLTTRRIIAPSPSPSPSPRLPSPSALGSVARPPPTISRNGTSEPLHVDSKRRALALKSRKKTAKLLGAAPSHLVYDEETNAMVPDRPFADESALGDAEAKTAARRAFVEAETARLRERDIEDREVARQRRREKRLKRKIRERGGDVDAAAVAAAVGDRSSGEEEEDDDDDGDDGDGQGLPVMERPFEDLADLYPSSDEGDGAGLDAGTGAGAALRDTAILDETSSEDDGEEGPSAAARPPPPPPPRTSEKAKRSTKRREEQQQQQQQLRRRKGDEERKKKKKKKKTNGSQGAAATASKHYKDDLEDLEKRAAGALGR